MHVVKLEGLAVISVALDGADDENSVILGVEPTTPTPRQEVPSIHLHRLEISQAQKFASAYRQDRHVRVTIEIGGERLERCGICGGPPTDGLFSVVGSPVLACGPCAELRAQLLDASQELRAMWWALEQRLVGG